MGFVVSCSCHGGSCGWWWQWLVVMEFYGSYFLFFILMVF